MSVRSIQPAAKAGEPRTRAGGWTRVALVVGIVLSLVVAINLVLFWPTVHSISREGSIVGAWGGGLGSSFALPNDTIIQVKWTTQPSTEILVCLVQNGSFPTDCGNASRGSFAYSTWENPGGTYYVTVQALVPITASVNVSVEIEYTSILASRL